ncbi:reverse transcriptase-like protein [Aureibacillus halotolerans]|uniref:RNase HI n=1 Tax=Aureibacillus halotolerans TaxID=1508390 RepID=A0A4R6U9G4_9BACI|nr:reverse transcriptase-like protein [Aureibacillus halotolerans]TDQ41469.1 RNase HI [Aureibacillus halotolerans]
MADVYIDGASAGNPGPSGAGFVVIHEGKVTEKSIPLPALTNHEAEWEALLAAVKFCQAEGIQNVFVKTDSQLIERAVESCYVKKPLYRISLDEVLAISQSFALFFVKWIPESQNKKADQLARRAIQVSKRS